MLEHIKAFEERVDCLQINICLDEISGQHCDLLHPLKRSCRPLGYHTFFIAKRYAFIVPEECVTRLELHQHHVCVCAAGVLAKIFGFDEQFMPVMKKASSEATQKSRILVVTLVIQHETEGSALIIANHARQRTGLWCQ